jgi:hypothetical protein
LTTGPADTIGERTMGTTDAERPPFVVSRPAGNEA